MPTPTVTKDEAQRLLQYATDERDCGACATAAALPDTRWPQPVCPFHLGGKVTEAEIMLSG